MKTNYPVLILLLMLWGCGEKSEITDLASTEALSVPPSEQKASEPLERKLIKEGYVDFETKNLTATRNAIYEAVEKYKGYVSSDQEFKSPGRISNTVVIRVPANSFDNFLRDATQGIEKFDSKTIDVRDVTEEFLDIQARLKTKKELEERFLDLLKQAKNVPEILEIEKEIGQLRSEIESIEGRLNYLENRVSYSTLTMTFYETLPNHTEFGEKFKNGFRNGWDNLIWFFVLLTNIWPFLLAGTGLIVGFRLYKKRK